MSVFLHLQIETLTKENRELTRKLDIARAKREGVCSFCTSLNLIYALSIFVLEF